MTDIYKSWREQLKSRQKKRTYKHFDSVIDLDDEKDFIYVIDKLKNITNHQFLPLVKFVEKDIRYRKDENKKPKRTIKGRPIMYASHIDAFIYSFFSYKWSEKYENIVQQKNIDTNVLAYRSKKDKQRGKNNINFAREVFEYIQNTDGCSVIIADISKFFDTLNHGILKKQLSEVLGRKLDNEEYKVFRSLIKFRYVLNDSSKKKKHSTYAKFSSKLTKYLRRNKCSLAQAVYEVGREGIIKENNLPVGIPQGSPLSGLLANIYMSDFDSEFTKMFPTVLYRRYSDDIAIVCATPDAESIFSWMNEHIKKYLLKISSSKVFIAKFVKENGELKCSEVEDGDKKKLGRQFIDYLGFEFNGSSVRIRGKTLQKAYKKADKRIKKFQLRQTSKNPRKKHVDVKDKKRNNNAYIKNANDIMTSIGDGISAQRSKLAGFIRKSKNNKN